MELSACVEVFSRGESDQTTYFLTVKPVIAKDGLMRHLRTQPDEVVVMNDNDVIVGDLGVRLLNGKSLQEVLGSSMHIIETY